MQKVQMQRKGKAEERSGAVATAQASSFEETDNTVLSDHAVVSKLAHHIS